MDRWFGSSNGVSTEATKRILQQGRKQGEFDEWLSACTITINRGLMNRIYDFIGSLSARNYTITDTLTLISLTIN